jgi:hypothetical protein
MFDWFKKKQKRVEPASFEEHDWENMTDEEFDKYIQRRYVENCVEELKAIKKLLDAWIEQAENAKKESYKDMKYIGDGIWIHKQYKDLHECLADVRMITGI